MLHVYWPVTACLTLVLIVGVIMTILKYGPKLCKTRHYAYTREDEHYQPPREII
ncbi:uncharacterized protein [Onthophagus taurus]|uniref:uncharacterized protein n=1 Tax=Onthophagus taurus TaxID=166361 RepID=UPI0039BEB2DD